MEAKKLNELKELACKIRIETLRGLGALGFGHLGGSLSIADVLAVLYGGEMNIDPQNPKMKERDYLVCSKGHAGPGVYAALAVKGYFPSDWMLNINKPGTHLPSHCDRLLTPGVDMTTGSLGQGSSCAVGVAYAHKISNMPNYTYLILGDGEIQEGQVWEAMSYATQHNLSNLITFVDYNKKQLDGYLADIVDFANIEERMASFGLNTVTVDGHDLEAISTAIKNAKASGKASCIVLDTIKAKGCTFASEMLNNHSIVLSEEMIKSGMDELEAELKKVVAQNV